MKLYFMFGSSSLAAHIAMREVNLKFHRVEVDYQTRHTGTGSDYRVINPKGPVPALRLDNGEVLTKIPVILQFVAEEACKPDLLPAPGTQRLRWLKWLNHTATEFHKGFSPLFRPTTPGAFLPPGSGHLCSRLAVVEHLLTRRTYLMGNNFSFADAYLFTVCRCLADQGLLIVDRPSRQRHFGLSQQRIAVKQALTREGLTQ